MEIVFTLSRISIIRLVSWANSDYNLQIKAGAQNPLHTTIFGVLKGQLLELWWEQVCRELWPAAKGGVLRWMEKQTSRCNTGFHRNNHPGQSDESGIYVGGKPLSLSNLASTCAKFQTNVQINLAIKACSSEHLPKHFSYRSDKSLLAHIIQGWGQETILW